MPTRALFWDRCTNSDRIGVGAGMIRERLTTTAILTITLLTTAACSRAIPAGPRPIIATSQTYMVKGEIVPVALDSVDDRSY
jgi:hypothetical protein